MDFGLPIYTPSEPSPSYNLQLRSEEQILEAALPLRRLSRTGTFTKKAGSVTLVLNEQGAEGLPEYGRNALVEGHVLIAERLDSTLDVRIKFDGWLILMLAEGGSSHTKLVSESYTMWDKRTFSSPCPTILPFAFGIPSTWEDGQRTRPLPPSYKISFLGVPGMFARAVYTLTVSVSRTGKGLRFWSKQKTLCTFLNYSPRTRPPRPILFCDLSFFYTIKSSPEEWHQVITIMKTRTNSGLQPIHCSLFIPSAQIYGLRDTIPFHLHLSAPQATFNEFIPSEQSSPLLHFPLPPHVKEKPSIRVFLLRQIRVEVRIEKAWRNCILGEGTLRPLPPPFSTCRQDGSSTLHWEGEVKCNQDITVGGFSTGKLLLRDFIGLAMNPPHPQTSPLIELHHTHPIRFVTDTWADRHGHPSEGQNA